MPKSMDLKCVGFLGTADNLPHKALTAFAQAVLDVDKPRCARGSQCAGC